MGKLALVPLPGIVTGNGEPSSFVNDSVTFAVDWEILKMRNDVLKLMLPNDPFAMWARFSVDLVDDRGTTGKDAKVVVVEVWNCLRTRAEMGVVL